MPEGDVVWYTARRLHEALAGQVLTRSDFRVPRYATVDLRGQLVTEAVARGKHLLIRTAKGLTVHTHLKMEGSWRVFPADKRLTESHKIRLVLANARWQAAGYLLGHHRGAAHRQGRPGGRAPWPRPARPRLGRGPGR